MRTVTQKMQISPCRMALLPVGRLEKREEISNIFLRIEKFTFIHRPLES